MVIHRCNSCNWPYVYFDVINHVLKHAYLIPHFLNRFGERKIFAVSITSGHWDFLWEDKHTLIQHSYWHGYRRHGEIISEWVTEYSGFSIRRVKLQTYYHQELFTFHMQSMMICTFHSCTEDTLYEIIDIANSKAIWICWQRHISDNTRTSTTGTTHVEASANWYVENSLSFR